MTKAELIRKLSRRAGVSDADARQFFEIFLQQSAYLLNAGEAITIKGFGFFQLKKGKIRNPSVPIEEQLKDTSYSDIIVYTPLEKETDAQAEKLIFNIPARKEAEYNNIDSYFSLSIGKPVIPLRGVKSSDFFIPAAGSELRRLLESKVDNLLSTAEINRNYTKGSEFLFVNPDSIEASQFEIDWNRNPGENVPGKRNVSWDFGDELSKQIEEESILDLGKEDVTEAAENLSWDFGADFIEEKITAEEEILPAPPAQPAEEIKEEPREQEKEIPAVNKEDENLKNFKRVTSFTREKNSKTPGSEKRSEHVTWQFGEVKDTEQKEPGQDIFNRYDDGIKDENGFTEVQNKRKTYDIELSSREQEKLDKLIREQESEAESGEDNITESFYKEENLTPEPAAEVKQEKYYSGGRSAKFFLVVALIVIVLVGAALYFYLKEGGLLKQVTGSEPVVTGTKPVKAVIINRTYEIPVTYPYKPAGDTSQQYIIIPRQDVSESGKPAEVPAAPEQETKTGEQGVNSEVIKGNQGSVKIKENLFKDPGNIYSVQVSAWSSQRQAKKEAERLRGLGHSVKIEKAYLGNRGTWYRVKVTGFRSQQEAEKFINTNK